MKQISWVATVGILALAAAPAHAALNAYLKLKGEKQGEIQGGVTDKGREKSIMVIAVSHEIVSPRDAASGLATGKRQHKPFVITKEIDKSTPLLYNVLVNNENIPEWELQFQPKSGVTTPGGYYSIKLTNARIASIRSVLPNTKDPNLTRFAEYEEVAFTYQKITWIYKVGPKQLTATDELSQVR
jgi:type VI secretion system secreted protein Hcp